MNTKSIIQLQIENIEVKNNFKKRIEALLEQYNVADAVFGINNNKPEEIVSGYFVPGKEFDDLSECIKEMNIKQGIRVVNNNKFILGDIYYNLSECANSEHVFNIEFLEEIY